MATSCKFDTPVSGGAHPDVREVSIEWNTRLKNWCLPEFRCRMHQTRPSALFFPIFSRAREKIGPPEARQKRPRRNESLQARLLILCARFFLSKPQTEFAVWVFHANLQQQSLRRFAPAPFTQGSLGGRSLLPSPMRGRWHGEAVTDEVEALASM